MPGCSGGHNYGTARSGCCMILELSADAIQTGICGCYILVGLSCFCLVCGCGANGQDPRSMKLKLISNIGLVVLLIAAVGLLLFTGLKAHY